MNKLTSRSARSVAETPKPLPFVMVKIPFTLHQRAKSVMKDIGLNIPLHFLVQQSLSEELDSMTIGTAMNTSGAEEEVSELTRLWKEEEARVKANGMHHVEPAAEKLPIQTFMEFVRENSLELIQCWSGRGSTTRGICFEQHGSERIVFVDKGRGGIAGGGAMNKLNNRRESTKAMVTVQFKNADGIVEDRPQLSLVEASQMFGPPVSQLRKLCRTGQLNPITGFGRKWYLSAEDLLRLFNKRLRKTKGVARWTAMKHPGCVNAES